MNNLLITTVPVSFEDSERDDAYDRIDHFLRNNLDDGNYYVYSDFLEKVYGNSSAELEKQLAASQAYAEQLREALDAVQQVVNRSDGVAGWHLNGDIASWDQILPEVEHALALPHDTSALDAYVSEKVKDVQLQDIEQYRLQMAGISTAAIGYWKEGDSIHLDYDTPALHDVAKLYSSYEARTKQRDLAVKALEKALSNINCEPFEWSDEENADAHKAAIEALSAIKESEAK